MAGDRIGVDVPYALITGDKDANMPAFERAVSDVFSSDGLRAYEVWKETEGKGNPGVSLLGIDRFAYRRIGEHHGFSPRASIRTLRDHWSASLDGAWDLVKYAAELAIPDNFSYSGQFTELYNRSPRPSGLLRSMASDPDEERRFASRQQVGLGLVVGEFIAYREHGGLRERNDQIRQVLNRHIFTDNGSLSNWERYVLFDATLNEYKGVSLYPIPPDQYTDIKYHFRQVRSIPAVGEVDYVPKEKDPKMAALKAFVESIRLGKPGTRDHVNDAFGARLVVMEGGMEAVDLTAKLVQEAIKINFKGVEVRDKTKPKMTRNQHPRIQEGWRRLLFTFPDLDNASWELLVRTFEAEMNANFRNGVLNPKTGLLEGWAEKHYKLSRIGLGWDKLFPEDIFGIDKNRALATASLNIADKLRNERIVHKGQYQPEKVLAATKKTLVTFKPGDRVVTEVEGEDRLRTYEILDCEGGKLMLKRPDGTTFGVHPHRLALSGMLGREKFLGVQEWLLKPPIET